MNLRLFFAALLSLALTACAFGKDEGKTERDNRAAREFDEARNELNIIVGKWHGQLVRATSTLPVEVDLSGIPVDTGQRDANGRSIYRLDTKIYFTSPADPIRFTASMRGAFIPSSTNYQIVVSNSAAQGPDDLGTLQLNIASGTLSGPLQSRSGQALGMVQLTRVEGRQNGSGDDVDEEDRINEIEHQVLSKLVGSYYGPVNVNGGSCRRYNVCFTITIHETPTPRGGHKASLKGHEYREDVIPGFFAGERNVSVDYDYRSNPQSVIMTSKGVAEQPLPIPYLVTVMGTFGTDRNGNADLSTLTGSYEVENLGQSGTAKLKRVPQCPKRPSSGACLVPRVNDDPLTSSSNTELGTPTIVAPETNPRKPAKPRRRP